MTKTASRLLDLLDAPNVIRFSRFIIFAMPFFFVVAAFAGAQWFNAKVAETPVVHFISEGQKKSEHVAGQHNARLLALEEYRRAAELLAGEDRRFKEEIISQMRSLTREFDRLAGAVEASNRSRPP